MDNDKTATMAIICQNVQCAWNSFPYNELVKDYINKFKYCPFCGMILTWKCSTCNTRLLDPDAIYCRHCGRKFEKT